MLRTNKLTKSSVIASEADKVNEDLTAAQNLVSGGHPHAGLPTPPQTPTSKAPMSPTSVPCKIPLLRAISSPTSASRKTPGPKETKSPTKPKASTTCKKKMRAAPATVPPKTGSSKTIKSLKLPRQRSKKHRHGVNKKGPKHDAPNLPAHFLLPPSSPLVRSSSPDPGYTSPSTMSMFVYTILLIIRFSDKSSRPSRRPVLMTQLLFTMEKVHELYADFRTLCGNSRRKIFEPLYQEFMRLEEFDSIDKIEVKIKLLLSQMEIRRQQIVSIAKPNEEGAVNEVIAYVAEMDAWKEDIEDFMHWAFMGRDDLQHQLFSASGRLRHLLSR
ncbi:uncharacterized protein C8R40DRAFT_1178653 [Lentinula edodes]|uniref:uncharacterized protein n=1 Tax=Lentinula edodes TaxID=5353 RepID=UPI001E8E3CA4|nr:uncharacterized protein C8R40DRAFT_1178653 [Lentinula edodes]KAH7867763.1 hypothetical protein C8R40DRAFT_1178653 [Lentinula edodes]